MICPGCGERAAKCDDYCVECCAEYYINGDMEYDPNEMAPGHEDYFALNSPLVMKRLWDWPGYDECEKLILAAREAA